MNKLPWPINSTACPACGVPYSISTFAQQIRQAYPTPEHGEVLEVGCSECGFLAEWVYEGQWDGNQSHDEWDGSELPAILGTTDELVLVKIDKSSKMTTIRRLGNFDPPPLFFYTLLLETTKAPTEMRVQSAKELGKLGQQMYKQLKDHHSKHGAVHKPSERNILSIVSILEQGMSDAVTEIKNACASALMTMSFCSAQLLQKARHIKSGMH